MSLVGLSSSTNSHLQSPPFVHNHLLFGLRGGGSNNDFIFKSSKKINFLSSKTLIVETRGGDESSGTSKKIKSVRAVAIAVPTLFLLWTYREKWLGLFNKEKLQSKTLEILHGLNDLPKIYSYTVYTLGMTLVELLGLSTIPVETAAGMVFGWTGLFLSGGGKLLGAILAFVIGRYGPLADWIYGKLSQNSFLQLVSDSADSNPFATAILLKISCFPETVKNYGSAILHPIKFWMFVLATAVHGWTFTSLWTYCGVDAAARLETTDLPADRRLQILLALAVVNGVVVSPLSMAYWIKKLKEHQKKSVKKK